MMYTKKQISDAVRKLNVSQIEKNYFQLITHLGEKEWRILRDDEYWEDRLECRSELSKRVVTLIHFAMKKNKLDSNTIFKMHNDLDDWEYINQQKSNLKKLYD